MPPKLKEFLLRWVNTMAGVVVASYVVRPGILWQKPLDLALAALLLGIFNAFLRPFLMVLGMALGFFSILLKPSLTLPLILLTPVFTLLINGLLLYLVSWFLTPGFMVSDFKSAFFGAMVITVVGLCLNLMIGTSNARVKIQRGAPPPNIHKGSDGSNGPVIDV